MASKRAQKLTIVFCFAAAMFHGIIGKQFPCNSGKLIPPHYFCDGDSRDCEDNGLSDESYGCSRNNCGSGKFTCTNNSACLPISVRCNGAKDCIDGSDELFCEMFHCATGGTIDSNWFCDNEYDCPDRSDESYGCTSRCGRRKFTCQNGECVPASTRCDWKKDCTDGSDELNCDMFQCESASFIHNSSFCDGQHDCSDDSDESFGCTNNCGRGKFTCSNGMCIPISYHCDGKWQCDDRSDEHNCDKMLFRCKNDALIHNYLFCNGKKECSDGSDESYGCSENCGRGNFTCNNARKQCLPIALRCDKKNDCDDGSDELDCDELSLENCTVAEGKYLCEDRSRCIPLASVCDGMNNCPDVSDEHQNCSARTDICDSTCPHPCLRLPQGPECVCRTTDNIHQTQCNEIEDCELSEDICEQRCLKYHGTELHCSCNEGYVSLHDNKSSCFNEVWFENMLLYSNRENIVGYNMTSREKIFVQNEIHVTSVSAAHDFVYWSASSSGVSKIFRTKMLYEEREELIYTKMNGTSPITCIAIDWMANNTFFTSQTLLSVCSNTDTICTHLKYSIFGIECVALLPRRGLMFWIQNTKYKYNKALILKSSMDGSNEEILVEENIHFSNHLVVDESSERIYWIDRERAVIESIKYNGKQRKIVVPQARNVFSFTIFEGIIYKALKYNNGIFFGMNQDLHWLHSDSDVKHIHIFNPLLQNTKITNPCHSVSCTGLCLLRPASQAPLLNYTCLYQHTETTTSGNSSWFPNKENASSHIWHSHTTSRLPEHLSEHFQTATEENSPILATTTATDNLHTLSVRSSKDVISEHQSVFQESGADVGFDGKIMLLISTIILLLVCVVVMLAFLYIKYQSHKQRFNPSRDIMNLQFVDLNNE